MKKMILIGLGTSLLAISCKPENINPQSSNTDSITTKMPHTDSVVTHVEIPMEKPIEHLPMTDIIKLADKKFNSYINRELKSMESKYGKYVLDLYNIHTGDFTGDGLEDIIVGYSIAPYMGNMTTYSIVLYKNTGNDIEFVKDYSHNSEFVFSHTSQGKIYIKELEYADEDPRCCPSIERMIELTVNGNKITSKKVD